MQQSKPFQCYAPYHHHCDHHRLHHPDHPNYGGWPERRALPLSQTANPLPHTRPAQIQDYHDGDNDDEDGHEDDAVKHGLIHLLRTVSTKAQDPVQMKLHPLWWKRLKSENESYFGISTKKLAQLWRLTIQLKICINNLITIFGSKLKSEKKLLEISTNFFRGKFKGEILLQFWMQVMRVIAGYFLLHISSWKGRDAKANSEAQWRLFHFIWSHPTNFVEACLIPRSYIAFMVFTSSCRQVKTMAGISLIFGLIWTFIQLGSKFEC